MGNGEDLTMIQVDLIQMDDYPADGCTISPTAFLLNDLFMCNIECCYWWSMRENSWGSCHTKNLSLKLMDLFDFGNN